MFHYIEYNCRNSLLTRKNAPRLLVACAFLILYIMGTSFAVETVTIDSCPKINWEVNSGFIELVDTNPFVCGTLGTTSFDTKHAGSTYWSWHATRCRVGKDWQSAAHRLGSIRCFIAPRDGKIELKGEVGRLKTSPQADPLSIIVRVGNVDAFTATLTAEMESKISYALHCDVKQGQCVRFIVQKKETRYPDEVSHLVWGVKENAEAATVRWDPVVVYADGKKENFQASKAFFTKPGTPTAQSPRQWRYEYRQLQLDSTRLPKDYDSNFSRMIQFEWLREDHLVEDSANSASKAKLNAKPRADAFYKAALFHWNQARQLRDELG
ncbi:MAG: hypothetical protein PHQ75_14605, partial [Thermoguttaceae bacterium]|nr:hypothetical protein [Thermoguttaceae bacterium]